MAKYKITTPKPMFVFNGTDLRDLNKQIKQIEDEFRVKEIDITFKEDRLIYATILSSADAFNFLKEIISDGLEVQEHFVVLYLNHANKVIGYYRHTKGTINSTQVDVEMIVAVGLKVLAKSVILAHNHPSGANIPSQMDKTMTKKVAQAFSVFDIKVLDHIIVTKNEYYSFADHGEGSLSGTGNIKTDRTEQQLRSEILSQLRKVTKANSPDIFQMLQTQEGYNNLENQIIHRVISQRLVPAAIIPQIESELNLN